MLLKLARNIDKDVNKGLGVRGTHLILSNAAHPAVFGGGILGSFVGSEIMDRAIPKTVVTHTSPSSSFFQRMIGKPVTTTTLERTLGQRFVHHAGRGLTAGIGAGLGAISVKAFQKKKEQQ